MKKSSFRIKEMDCPSEEHLVRSKLEGINSIRRLSFDLTKRNLEVYHLEDDEALINALHSLNLGAELIDVSTVDEDEVEEERSQKKVLWIVLLINFGFFILEMSTGLISKSMGLVADSLDMLADSFVYGLSLFAVGTSSIRKKTIAKTAGYFQIILALIGFAEVLRRFLGFGQVPDFKTMIIISILALIGNMICLIVLQRSRSSEAHMQASMIFTSNDIVINLGVVLAGIAVMYFESNYPDLIIGFIIFIIVTQGAFRILKLSSDK